MTKHKKGCAANVEGWYCDCGEARKANKPNKPRYKFHEARAAVKRDKLLKRFGLDLIIK